MDRHDVLINLKTIYPIVGSVVCLLYPPAQAANSIPSANNTISRARNDYVTSNLIKWQNASEHIYECSFNKLNTCAPRKPMRTLSAEELQLIIGANYTTGGQTQTRTHGSCTANGCTVTASPPPQTYFPPSSAPPSSAPPPSEPPPDSGSSGGSNNNLQVPSAASQQHLEHCAIVYGGLSPTLPTIFTTRYGWTAENAEGVWIAHTSTATDVMPPLPTGAKDWLYIGATTFLSKAQNQQYGLVETDVYMYAYTSDANIVGVLAHEWYHQNHDTPGESLDQYNINAAGADAAGTNAMAAYKADNGAKCQ